MKKIIQNVIAKLITQLNGFKSLLIFIAFDFSNTSFGHLQEVILRNPIFSQNLTSYFINNNLLLVPVCTEKG